jgi:hypothetical protein
MRNSGPARFPVTVTRLPVADLRNYRSLTVPLSASTELVVLRVG